MNSNPEKETLRLSKIDFLRGIAVILVLTAHHWWIRTFFHMGWIGVDLFFVLSGFLVSGLLFAEYKKFGHIKPLYFLARRGFKIYPLFYTSILISFLLFVRHPPEELNYKGVIVELLTRFLPEIFFLQSYYEGFWAHHWSLAVEEHFYILLSILIFLLIKRSVLTSRRVFFSVAFGIFAGCLLLRIASNVFFPKSPNLYETHLRIDSLFAGVFIAFIYHFHFESLIGFYRKYKKGLIALAFIPLIFQILGINSLFTKTVGFTLLYISFGALLILFLFSQKITDNLKKIFTPFLYRLICTIGFYSYGIYLFHMYFVRHFIFFQATEDEQLTNPERYIFVGLSSFLLFFTGSVLLGMVVSRTIEIPFLKLRERYFPRRTA